jgi:transposase
LADQGLIFPENIGSHLSLDETCLSHGELYTILTNKSAKGNKGTLVAILKGAHSETIIPLLERIPIYLRKRVQEITLDLAGNMSLIVKRCF